MRTLNVPTRLPSLSRLISIAGNAVSEGATAVPRPEQRGAALNRRATCSTAGSSSHPARGGATGRHNVALGISVDMWISLGAAVLTLRPRLPIEPYSSWPTPPARWRGTFGISRFLLGRAHGTLPAPLRAPASGPLLMVAWHNVRPSHGSCLDTAAQDIIREKLLRRALPVTEPTKTWAGYSAGDVCDGCGERILRGEVEFELECANYQPLTFHARCVAIWRMLKDQLTGPPGESPPAAGPPPSSGASRP
jgi:hypothetical protein